MSFIDVISSFETPALREGNYIEENWSFYPLEEISAYGFNISYQALAYRSVNVVNAAVLPSQFKIEVTTSRSPESAEWNWKLSVCVSDGINAVVLGDLGSQHSYNGSDLTREYIAQPNYAGLPGDIAGCHWFLLFTFRDMNWGEQGDYLAPEGFNFIQAAEAIDTPAQPRLFRHTGRTVEYTYTAPPPPPYTPPPPVTSSPPPSKPSNKPPVTNVTPPPSPPPGNSVSGQTGTTMVPCSPGPNGEDRYSIWQTGPGGNLIKRISPCQ